MRSTGVAEGNVAQAGRPADRPCFTVLATASNMIHHHSRDVAPSAKMAALS